MEKEWLMTLDVAYERLDWAIYNHSACPETADILYIYLDDEKREITIPPKELAKKLMEADKNHLMDNDIFNFIDKALRDGYYSIKDPWCSYCLGCLYYFERFKNLNYEKAFNYFSKEKHIGPSTVLLGECYFYGRGTEQNYEKAFFCLIQSALTNNSARSLYLIGDMYLNGYYVDKDIPEANDLCFHALEVADEVDSSNETKAEIYERLGKVYLLRPKTLETLHFALKNFNLAEQHYLEAMQECMFSLKDKVKGIRDLQMEVREYLDDLILMSKEPVS